MTDDPRPVATRIKHEILHQYLEVWGAIISHGLRNAFNRLPPTETFYAKLVYVDCFAHRGKYERNGVVVYGSPIIGIQQLDTLQNFIEEKYGFHVETNFILIEEDKTYYEVLKSTLKDFSLEQRSHFREQLPTLADREIAVLSGDYRKYLPDILRLAQRQYHWSFFLLDPFGARGIDLKSVQQIITHRFTDSIIYFPYLDVQKKTGSILADNPTHIHHQHLQYIDHMFGSKEWRGMAITDISSSVDPMPRLVEYYQDKLESLDRELAVKKIPLKFEDKDRDLYYLFLTTHDGTGALKMNEILDSAAVRQFDYRHEKRAIIPEMEPLFPQDEMELLIRDNPKRPAVPEVDVNALSSELMTRFYGQTYIYRAILKAMANSSFYVDDIKEALKELKKSKQVTFDTPNLVHRTKVTFS